jgi:hypothetical protein
VSLPGGIATVVVTGDFVDASGEPLVGRVTLTPTADLTDPGNSVTIPAVTRTYTLSRGRFESDPLIATDNSTVTPANWAYTVQISLQNLDPISYEILLPQAVTPVDLSALTPVAAQPAVSAYLTLAGGTVTGPLTLDVPLGITSGGTGGGSRQAAINALTGSQSAGTYLRSDGTNASLSAIQAADVPVLNQYSKVFSPLSYGAAGDGVTSDTTALQACITAAIAASGVVDLGTNTYLTSSPLTMGSNFHLRGAGSAGGAITNSTSSIFTCSGNSVVIENCTLTASAGHIFDATAGPFMSAWKLLGVQATQNSPSHGIWNQTAGSCYETLVDQNCSFTVAGARADTGCATFSSTTVTDTHAVSGDAGLPINGPGIPSGTTISSVSPGTGYVLSQAATATASSLTFYVGGATVSPWSVVVAGALNSCAFRNLRTQSNYSPVPFFDLEGGSYTGYSQNITFDNILSETPAGGVLKMSACAGVTIGQWAIWDATYYYDLFHFFKSGGGYPCRNIVVRNSGRSGGTLASGVNDIYADSYTTNILLESNGGWSVAPTLSVPAAQTTIINPVEGGTAPVMTAPVFASAGTAGATAASRYAGATTSGAPTGSNAFLAGDYVVDYGTPAIWVCTAGGSPGTWTAIGGGTSTNIAWFTATGSNTWTKPSGAQSVDVVLLAAGGGGGSGAIEASGTAASGGGGGGGGGMLQRSFAAADLSSTVTVTVGAGGAGGAAVSGSSASSGITGSAGGGTSFGSYCYTFAGGAGGGGTTSTGSGGSSSALNMVPGSAGGAGSPTAPGAGGNSAGATGGGGGGGVSPGGSPAACGGQIASASLSGSPGNTGSAGVVSGASPGSGTAPTVKATPSCGGGGGAGALSGTAQTGATASYGGGGGGGGGCLTGAGNSSGEGGSGGNGWALVVTHFS